MGHGLQKVNDRIGQCVTPYDTIYRQAGCNAGAATSFAHEPSIGRKIRVCAGNGVGCHAKVTRKLPNCWQCRVRHEYATFDRRTNLFEYLLIRRCFEIGIHRDERFALRHD